ncbi:zinc finger CCCH domain-containing protein 14 isoform X2 [Diachasma alloeum]|uniref:zinc finger CCCH domain-containing protein 14 isoform X2 n=1 Tax=Diachasma alloeum TaxID=454923 RepID=UPI0007383A2E|nr:zinc finger CCCH domain-containing protein 14 isoform X2 [Diachasma alloeum]
MDIRGIEVTNQLRSAIRAKLLELGVRYDEELPDYILVMVVNKKTRQQMHEDLNLFLENNTTPFVDWLHDQVLKKLQKVTIAKKKPPREFLPTVIVKQEEERKKKRSITQAEEESKEESVVEKSPLKPVQDRTKDSAIPLNKLSQMENLASWSPSPPLQPHSQQQSARKSFEIEENSPLELDTSEKRIESIGSSSKRISERDSTTERPEKRLKMTDSSKSTSKQSEEIGFEEKRIKSCINKPRITSVVSVKTTLGLTSPRKKFLVNKDRTDDTDYDYRRKDTRFEKRPYELINRRNISRGRSFEDELGRSSREESNNRTSFTNNKGRILGGRELAEKAVFPVKSRIEGTTGNIKDRLGQAPKLRIKDSQEDYARNIRNRIGAVTSKFRALGRLGVQRVNKDEDGEIDEDDTAVPIKSHIIAVNNSTMEREGVDRRSLKKTKKLENDDGIEAENEEGKALASKVIVTPRPLKPLQPVQKRATQSLLLRAVAEANQSVVKQKNPEPILKEKMPIVKQLRTSRTREIAQNLSVHLNSTKRLVMEKIQVELTNPDTGVNDDPEPYVPRSVTEEQMGVVMSLFQRGDDNQKFLVTLNGYNNNVMKEKNLSDDEERLEMEVNEEDELVLSNAPNESSPGDFEALESEELDTSGKIEEMENNENNCIDNWPVEDPMIKRRKLSPIIYTRSSSPEDFTTVSPGATGFEKRPPVAPAIISDTSREKCRYWPNCTLGKKCAYLHPAVLCRCH